MALLLRYNGPDATLSFSIMVDVLLMVVIGGMGTLYGPALGAALIVLAQILPADRAAGRSRTPPPACRSCRRSSTRTAGCSGSGCCSC